MPQRAGSRRTMLDLRSPSARQAQAERTLGAGRLGAERPALHLVIGMLSSKDPGAILAPLAGRLASVGVVPVAGHEAHGVAAFAPHCRVPVRAFAGVPEALAALPPEGDVLIAGSLYLAGEVLRLNRELPD